MVYDTYDADIVIEQFSTTRKSVLIRSIRVIRVLKNLCPKIKPYAILP